ncbi:hypothetical protein J6590_078639 [Homalodisca vitripennis]|nr:hypothetical protein J6590_078639 [Homalodisca vitripennis]
MERLVASEYQVLRAAFELVSAPTKWENWMENVSEMDSSWSSTAKERLLIILRSVSRLLMFTSGFWMAFPYKCAVLKISRGMQNMSATLRERKSIDVGGSWTEEFPSRNPTLQDPPLSRCTLTSTSTLVQIYDVMSGTSSEQVTRLVLPLSGWATRMFVARVQTPSYTGH